MTILVTGGAGFIGSHFVKHLLKAYSHIHVINVDALTYAGHRINLEEIMGDSRHEFIHGDITDEEKMKSIITSEVDYIVNFAAESHVDRSIHYAETFVKTNVLGTNILLECAKEAGVKKFLQISTDEVYGSLGKDGFFTEDTPLAPSSPYSASKASADLLVRAYYKTYDLPINITRCSNNYGSHQMPEKLIPLMICNCKEGKELPIYGTGLNVRDWIHVEDHCRGICKVLFDGRPGQIYNLGGRAEKTNIEIVTKIIDTVGGTHDQMVHVEDRLGHDFRYAIDDTKIRNELGWKPKVDFEEGMEKTIKWYLEHEGWCEHIRNGLQDYYKQHYH